jgi:cobalamin transport system ATP-binding protein
VTRLELDRVSVALGGRTVVERVSLAVGEGRWAALIGANGSGKTSTLRAVAGLLRYDGRVLLAGANAAAMPRRERARRVAMVPQIPTTPADMTVSDYVRLGRTPHGGYFGGASAGDRAAANRALDRLELAAFAQRPFGSLSGGERQRAVLARALAQEATILLLDEPTAALDVGRQQQVLEFVDRLRGDRQLTILSAMHDLTLAGQYADRLVLLNGGRVVATGTAGEVLTGDVISMHYGAEVAVLDAPGVGLAVVPVRRQE